MQTEGRWFKLGRVKFVRLAQLFNDVEQRFGTVTWYTGIGFRTWGIGIVHYERHKSVESKDEAHT
jgi:hypothetical protein